MYLRAPTMYYISVHTFFRSPLENKITFSLKFSRVIKFFKTNFYS